jgi:tRNA-specific 2-thiouridylase
MARRPKVLVAMSGGVDSSVAAALLVRQGYEVVGCFMRLGSPGETLDELIPYDSAGVTCDPARIRIGHQGCCSINDAADARLVAAKLGIPFYVCNFKKDFGRIIDYFVGEYNAGRTPNPCIRCNDWLKFGRLHEYARQIDAAFVASGHYARVVPEDGAEALGDERSSPPTHDGREAGRDEERERRRDNAHGAAPRVERQVRYRLLRGVDHAKDQSYVLFGLPRERLSEMLLPIGGFRKAEVRRMARELELPVYDKADSQEICFVPDNDYAGLVARRAPESLRAGSIVDRAGQVLGEHRGHQHFTIGQRKGIGLALGRAVYVVEKDAATNTVVVGERDDLLATGCTAGESNWLVSPPSRGEWWVCAAKIRYNAQPVAARVRAAGERAIEVVFDEPQAAVAPGQAVVCYRGDVILCGGWISSAA